VILAAVLFVFVASPLFEEPPVVFVEVVTSPDVADCELLLVSEIVLVLFTTVVAVFVVDMVFVE
jgi:hypothetical protein